MRAGPQTVRIGYFGKLPSCADFIKVVDNLALAGLLDDWLAAVLNVLSAEPRWKLSYDVMRPLQFAFIGTRSRRAIGGHLAASSDSSQRRYPFLCMSAIDIDQPARFGARSPLVLAPLWTELSATFRKSNESNSRSTALAFLRAPQSTITGSPASTFRSLAPA